jgi:hypothetical protein
VLADQQFPDLHDPDDQPQAGIIACW